MSRRKLGLAVVAAMCSLAASAGYVAEVGGKMYTKFSDALANVSTETPVLTLLADCDSGTYPNGDSPLAMGVKSAVSAGFW